jgi:hypothetical protein
MQILHFLYSYYIAQFILLSIFPKRWTERLFLVTHCLQALYKGLFQQSDSLCGAEGPTGSCPKLKNFVFVFLFIILTLGGWIFLAKM